MCMCGVLTGSAIITMLPSINKKVLRPLLGFLRKISENAAVNKMSPANLGIVFAPTLLQNPHAKPEKVRCVCVCLCV